MTQINYDGKGFYTLDPVTKEREPISVSQLPEALNPGEQVFFDYNDSLIFHKPVTRDQLVAECQKAYRNPNPLIPKNNLIVNKKPVKSLGSL